MGASACLELASRRPQQYTEAFAHGPYAPNWASAKHFSGSSSSLNLVPPKMRSYASHLSREETKLEHLRATAKTHAAGASPGVCAAVLVGGLPSGAVGDGDEGKGTGKKASEAKGLARHSDVSTEGSQPSDRLPQHKVRLAA